jgi:hypothetical protein
MSKRNIYLTIINALIFITTIVILKNTIVEFLLLLVLVQVSIADNKPIKILLLLFGIINFLFGKTIILMTIILLLLYLIYLFNYYSKEDILNNYIYLFKKNPHPIFIKIIYFPSSFKANYLSFKKYHLSLKELLKITRVDLNNLVFTFTKRGFYNKNKLVKTNKVLISDFKVLLFYVTLLIITIILWRNAYALFA